VTVQLPWKKSSRRTVQQLAPGFFLAKLRSRHSISAAISSRGCRRTWSGTTSCHPPERVKKIGRATGQCIEGVRFKVASGYDLGKPSLKRVCCKANVHFTAL